MTPGGTTNSGNFQRIFNGPITVEGGDGFSVGAYEVWHRGPIDAVVIDALLPNNDPPLITTLSPVDDATGVVRDADLVASFDQPINLTGSGSVTITNLDTAASDVISLPDGRVTASGGTLTITLTNLLDTTTDYAVQISNDSVESLSNNAFAGILDTTTWNFTTTSDGTAPLLSSTVPADNATGVATSPDLTMTFNETVKLSGSGSVIISNLSGGTSYTITLPDSQVTVSGSTVTINPTAHLALSTDYAIRISADAIRDSNGNAYAGIQDDTSWNFSTFDWPAPSGVRISSDKIVSSTYGVTGTLVVIDVPYEWFSETPPVGPDWSESADDGWSVKKSYDRETASQWEPDGTPTAQARTASLLGNGASFDAEWTFDLNDDIVIHAVYATWNDTGTGDRSRYHYSEGASSGNYDQSALPAGDLELRWTDSGGGSQHG